MCGDPVCYRFHADGHADGFCDGSDYRRAESGALHAGAGHPAVYHPVPGSIGADGSAGMADVAADGDRVHSGADVPGHVPHAEDHGQGDGSGAGGNLAESEFLGRADGCGRYDHRVAADVSRDLVLQALCAARTVCVGAAGGGEREKVES